MYDLSYLQHVCREIPLREGKKKCTFLQKTAFSNLHVFPYSPREGTPAASMPGRVTGIELERRLQSVNSLKKKMVAGYWQSLKGSSEKVLPEKRLADGSWEGWTGNYVRCKVILSEHVQHDLIPVRLLKFDESGVFTAEADFNPESLE